MPISPELSFITHQKSLETLYSPDIHANSEASSDDELKGKIINKLLSYYIYLYVQNMLYYFHTIFMLNIVKNPQENSKSKKSSVYAKKQTRLVN